MPKVYSKLFSFSRFAGMNKVEKDFRVPISRDKNYNVISDMEMIENLDIDNSMVLSTRPGSSLKLAGSSIHSLWSDKALNCLFVDSEVLYRLNINYSSTPIASVGSGRMSYAVWNDKIYMTNGTTIGYLKGDTFSALTDPVMNYKKVLPAGKFIAYYRGRLYVAKGKVLYISDALCDHYDIRTGFKVFSNDITMLAAVGKGLYVSDGNAWFLSGLSPDDFTKEKVLDYDSIPYAFSIINGSLVGEEGVQGQCLLWTSLGGICLGDGNGTVKNLTRERYPMSTYGIGCSSARKINETVHYITVLE